jgi:UDP-glucuronate 4-epimerase
LTVLVTGAAGFIGSHLIAKLSDSGKKVIGVDNFNDYYSVDLKRNRTQNLMSKFGVPVMEIDLSDSYQVAKLIRDVKPDSVIHLAAQAGVRLPISQTNRYVQSNLQGFSNILIECIKEQIPRFLYASSSSVYGSSLNLPYSESDLSLRPLSFYGATKLSNELLAASLARNSNTRVRGLRFFTVYGEWGRPDMAYFRLINSALSGAEFTLFGDGAVKRDFTYIDDVTKTVSKLLEQLDSEPLGFHDIVNIGGGNPVSMNEMISLISKHSDLPLKIIKIGKHLNDVQNTEADPKYLCSLIGFIPTTTLDEGLTSVFEWAKNSKIRNSLEDWISSSV